VACRVWFFSIDHGFRNEDSIMADPARGPRDRTGNKAIPQHEADAQLLREKTARLRALRLAREAADAAANDSSGQAPVNAQVKTATKKTTGKSRAKGPSLADWLSRQQNEGRRG
jgi:hypothetical protein